ncbi:MAG: gliding motility-associated ABC transporter ATP-binding subunit GldA [Bacteroidia bacterium]|nr:gliding motility-associated ABC transporter ATP-binding subunit GldA [Bacteroidia bacterium]
MSIRVENLTKTYKKQNAIDHISFDIKSGEIVGFLGPNGAGKTTTMKILTCYLPPSAGKAYVNGLDVEENSIEVRRQIGYLPEHNPLYTDMYVKEYLQFVGSVYKIKNKHSRVKEMISLTGLEREQNKQIGQLSKGYRQRVGLAQAMIHDPSVLILDEPTSGLDPNQIAEIRHLIMNIGREKTVLLSTHIMQEVEAMCSRVMIINRGEIVANGQTGELKHLFSVGNTLLATFNKTISGEFLASLEELGEVKSITGTTYSINSSKEEDQLKSEVFNFAVKHQLIITEMKMAEHSLEEIFKNVTKSNA